MELLQYLLKVIVCNAVFFSVYLLFFRKLTFFRFNRFYLLTALLLSFVIPTVIFTIEREVKAASILEAPQQIDYEIEGHTMTQEIVVGQEPILEEVVPFDWSTLIIPLYVIVALICITIALKRLLSLTKHTQNYTKEGRVKVVSKKSGFTNCSFFNYVFVDERGLTEKEMRILLAHELVHVNQYHSVDKILMLIAKSVLWFNPIIYLYDKALEEMHEFEADSIACKSCGNADYASLLLRLTLYKSDLPLAHSFVKSPVKSRIKMLFNHKTNTMKKFVYLAVLPALLSLIYGFTIRFLDVSPLQNQNEKEFTVVLDAGHGGNKKGVQVKGYAEKDLTLSIANKIKAIGEANGIKVVTTRNADEDLALKDRTKVGGTILLVLHVNSSKNAAANGIDMITSGDYGVRDGMKLAKSNSMTYYLYKELKNLAGIKVNHKPKHSNVALLNAVAMPGIVLEMGFLSNPNDFNFITNEQRQNELASKIVAGILAYKKFTPSDEVIAARQKESDSMGKAFLVWRQSDKYRLLTSEAAKLSGKILTGEIESLHHFSVRKILDGLILNSGGKKYRVYIHPSQMAKLDLKQGQRFTAHVKKAEAWFDSEYPVLIIDPQLLPKLGINQSHALGKEVHAVLITGSPTKVDAKTNVMDIENAKFKIGGVNLEAENATWDKTMNTITAKRATILKDGEIIYADKVQIDLKAGVFSYSNPKLVLENSTNKNKTQSSKTAVAFRKELLYSGDSSRLDRVNQILTLIGNSKIALGKIQIDGSLISFNKIEKVAHIKKATMKDGKNSFYADSLVFDFNANKGRFYGPSKLTF